MYRCSTSEQESAEHFSLPFGGHLSPDNRWVKLASSIPWQEYEREYAKQFSADMGAPAKPFRMALGALIIKEKLGVSDVETVQQIRENPYLQYFLGLQEYSDSAPFDASMMVHFRKRIHRTIVGRVNEHISRSATVESTSQQTASEANVETKGEADNSRVNNEEHGAEASPTTNVGTLIVDATCAPADIRYPTDLSLLNQAREASEEIIDVLYEQVRDALENKPRTYRRKARREYLAVSKQRKPIAKVLRKAVGGQLRYLRRNLAHIDVLIAKGASLTALSARQYRLLLVISEVLRQQQWMYEQRTHRIEDRIVSLSQPHVRPIVRGKAGTPVEFGAKLSVSVQQGWVSLDELSWNAFNESEHLPAQVEAYKERWGHYPASVQADKIYRTRANRAYCRERGIRLSGPPLGRPTADTQAQQRQQTLADAKVRNQIEGKFGQAKRRFGLARVMAKLSNTAETAISITFLVINLERLLWALFVVVLCGWTTALTRCSYLGRQKKLQLILMR
jgi:transposase, IS5 family